METDILPNPWLKCPILSMPKLNMDHHEEVDSKTILGCGNEKVLIDLYLKNNGGESSNNNKCIESAPMGAMQNEVDKKENDLCLEESFYIKSETETYKNIDVALDNNVIEPCTIKKETNDVNEMEAEELLNYTHESPFKSEIIEQEEVHIKEEADNEDKLNEKNYSHESPFKSEIIEQEEVHIKQETDNEDRLIDKIPKPRKKTVLHQCPECPYSTDRKRNLKLHSGKHKKEYEIGQWYSCQKCSYRTYRKQVLMRHTEIHNNLVLKCAACSYETLRSSELKKHQREHKPDIQWLQCPKCSFKTRVQSYFRKHSLTHNGNAFKCTNCSYHARSKYQLALHQVKHESINKWHFCSLCPFKTHAKKILVAHCQRRHNVHSDNPNQVVIFKCTECPYKNGCKRDLKQHQLIHDQGSWLQCSDCAYKTPYKSDLKKHQVRHQEENEEVWRRCQECSYKTRHKYELQKHVLSHKTVGEIKWFECSQCSFKTRYRHCLRQHQLMHKEAHEIEWFYCYECGYKTKRKSYLATHISKHKKQIGKSYLQNSGK